MNLPLMTALLNTEFNMGGMVKVTSLYFSMRAEARFRLSVSVVILYLSQNYPVKNHFIVDVRAEEVGVSLNMFPP